MDFLSGITHAKHAVTHLLTPENVYGRKGSGAMADPHGSVPADVTELGQNPTMCSREASELGVGYKVRPRTSVLSGQTIPLMDVPGPGAVTHIWITVDAPFFRHLVLRFYWDGSDVPAVEVPLGDFFLCGFGVYHPVTAIPINDNPTSGLNCYFPMPFRTHARITLENRGAEDCPYVYYAISYEEREVEKDELYFCATYRQSDPVTPGVDHVLLSGVKGRGHYVGTALAWQQNTEKWWGEGEVKAYIDGDGEYPTYVGTGTEDYFGGAWCFNGAYSAPYLGYFPLNREPGPEANSVGGRHMMYRFHLPDPIRFSKDLRVTIQALGWKWRTSIYLALRDKLSSVAYWYQDAPMPDACVHQLPTDDELDVFTL